MELSKVARIALLVLAVVSSSALAQQVMGGGGTQTQPLRSKEELQAQRRAIDGKRLRAMQAMKERDYALAERIFREVCDLAPHPFEHIHLARLYDLQGREREAMREYEIVLKGDGVSVSTLQSDPRVLARFGDLCAKFRREKDAATAYLMAIESFDNDERTNRIRIAPPNKSLTGLRVTAHLVAGSKDQWQGNWERALAHYDIAVETMPNWWMGWYFRGAQRARRTALREGAQSDLLKAESLASGKNREFVRQRTKAHGLKTLGGAD